MSSIDDKLNEVLNIVPEVIEPTEITTIEEIISEEMIEILKVMEIGLNLDQIIQTTTTLKEKLLAEITIMLQS